MRLLRIKRGTGVDHAVQLLAEAARGAISAASGAGVTFIRNGARTSTGHTADVVKRADLLQYELEQGPCLTAWASSTVVRIDDTRTDPRWPQWCAAVARFPLLSSVSAPLLHGKGSVGAVMVYSERAEAFSAADEALLVRLSSAITALLMHVQTSDTPLRMRNELHLALRGRDMVGVAKGMLMERNAMTEPEAHRYLLQVSASLQQPLQRVAEAFINRMDHEL
ncbi:GAF and ANTAR domain-containing protein [Arthrobacter deserti]|uniref:GAF and ANTAR domain-containing protein n=1 Tax=Arthrobacter deserti TaxID=1742687 RepID=A0ABX1JMY5_9MICC|nr:GAF and ANTAR domain-containing protein [Arthrobacter deserti]